MTECMISALTLTRCVHPAGRCCTAVRSRCGSGRGQAHHQWRCAGYISPQCSHARHDHSWYTATATISSPLPAPRQLCLGSGGNAKGPTARQLPATDGNVSGTQWSTIWCPHAASKAVICQRPSPRSSVSPAGAVILQRYYHWFEPHK